MDGRDRKRFAARVKLVSVGMTLALGVAAARTFELQVRDHESLARLSREQYLNEVKIPARRGNIYDQTGKPLAISVDVPSIYVSPADVVDPRAAARALAPVVELPLDVVYAKLGSSRLFAWLKRQVSPEMAAAVKALGLPGVHLTSEPRRFYPNRELAAHVLGFTGIDARGLEGIEKSLEGALAGEPQVASVVRDGRGRAVLSASLDPDRLASGADVHLTLDARIQHAAEVALKKAVSTTRARAATAVALDVQSADVLAMAVYPGFNPNTAAETAAERRRNRAVTDVFEPGSSMKPLVTAVALDDGKLKADSIIFCENGSLTIGQHTIRDTSSHGWLSLTGIIEKSSNIGAAKIGQTLGRERLGAALRAYGFGQKSGATFPGEVSGLLRDPSSWSEVGVATISYGHGVAVTALQLAAAYRVLAAEGAYKEPRLVARIDGRGGEADGGALRRERQVLRAQTTRRLRGMLEAAVGSEGTGTLANVPGYRVAGKTGTAQKIDPVSGGYSSDKFVAVFAGFAPAEAPRVVVVVAVDEPVIEHTGGAVAAPVFADIVGAALRYLGVPPTGFGEEPRPAARVAAALERARAAAANEAAPTRDGPRAAPGAVPSFLGLTAREAVEQFALVGRGLDLSMAGTGRVVRQDPPAGADRAKLARLTLELAEE